ncbi:MAG: J domain-containing protein [Spirochaetales bacterium]|nr:J domain-containing protein [Spirochaetales bacterium]
MNPFIEEFNHKQKVTPEDLKARFRKLSKKEHPDLGGSNRAFIKLQEQYQEARDFFLKTDFSAEAPLDSTALYRAKAREALFQYLHHYKILDLPFVMVKRQDPRFEKIWQEIQFWAAWYDPVFKNHLEEYHRLFSTEAKVEDRYFIIGQKHFEKAFLQFLDFELSQIKAQARICLSYIHDARSYLSRGKDSPYHRVLRNLAVYFKQELEKTAL